MKRVETWPHGEDTSTGLGGGPNGGLLAPGAVPTKQLAGRANCMCLCLCKSFPLSLTLNEETQRRGRIHALTRASKEVRALEASLLTTIHAERP